MRYLDPNVFLYAALDAGARGEAAGALLRSARPGETATCALTVDEVTWALWKARDRPSAAAAGKQMLSARNVTYLPVTPEHMAKALDLVEAHGLRPHDAIHAAVALAAGIQEIVSDDAGFDRVPGLRRVRLA